MGVCISNDATTMTARLGTTPAPFMKRLSDHVRNHHIRYSLPNPPQTRNNQLRIAPLTYRNGYVIVALVT